MICNLCKAKEQRELIIQENDLAVSFLPHAPLSEGHVMILPRRHVLYHDLTKDEHQAIAEIISQLKDHLKKIYPEQHPLLISATDTSHSSVPGHIHFHLVPSRYGLRPLIAKTHGVDERKEVSPGQLKEMTLGLRKQIFNQEQFQKYHLINNDYIVPVKEARLWVE